MAETKEFTYKDVSVHSSKKDIQLVIHDKVYNVTSFVDEHPGGEEVLLDLGGQEATEAFEDVGHSDEAREILDGLFLGNLKRVAGDPAPKAAAPVLSASTVPKENGGLGFIFYAFILVGGGAAYFAYQYLQASSKESGK